MHELQPSFHKRKSNLVKMSISFFECKQQKPILMHLSKKEKVLVRNSVINRREKRLKKWALKEEGNQDGEITCLTWALLLR